MNAFADRLMLESSRLNLRLHDRMDRELTALLESARKEYESRKGGGLGEVWANGALNSAAMTIGARAVWWVGEQVQGTHEALGKGAYEAWGARLVTDDGLSSWDWRRVEDLGVRASVSQAFADWGGDWAKLHSRLRQVVFNAVVAAARSEMVRFWYLWRMARRGTG